MPSARLTRRRRCRRCAARQAQPLYNVVDHDVPLEHVHGRVRPRPTPHGSRLGGSVGQADDQPIHQHGQPEEAHATFKSPTRSLLKHGMM